MYTLKCPECGGKISFCVEVSKYTRIDEEFTKTGVIKLTKDVKEEVTENIGLTCEECRLNFGAEELNENQEDNPEDEETYVEGEYEDDNEDDNEDEDDYPEDLI